MVSGTRRSASRVAPQDSARHGIAASDPLHIAHRETYTLLLAADRRERRREAGTREKSKGHRDQKNMPKGPDSARAETPPEDGRGPVAAASTPPLPPLSQQKPSLLHTA
jgi:hypothetical protein